MGQENSERIAELLRTTNSLLRALIAMTAASGLVGMSVSDKIRLLGGTGLKQNEISEILHVSAASVSKILHEVKKSNSDARKKDKS